MAERIRFTCAGLLALAIHAGVALLLMAGGEGGSNAVRVAAHSQSAIQAFFVEPVSAPDASDVLQNVMSKPTAIVAANGREWIEPNPAASTSAPVAVAVVAEKPATAPILLTIITPPDRPLVVFAGSRGENCSGDSMERESQKKDAACPSE
jgi:hypothetical protein